MSEKKAATRGRKVGADKQRENSARKPKGKPFAKGNPYTFKPGQSGNPKGRPKSRTLSEAYRAMLACPLPEDPTRTYADAVAETLCREAVIGNVIAAKELADRTEGRPRQAIDLSVEERKRQVAERAIEALMIDAGIERDEAIEQLATLTPEIKTWIN